ncbi:MAG: hypothetical protein ACE5GK_07400 [Nitrospiria bacterium]
MKKTFDQFKASLLYCNRCGRAMPVRERLLLVLPNGEMYDYLCQGCGTSIGSKTEKEAKEILPASAFNIPKIPPNR